MGSWTGIWGRLSPLDRDVACAAYLESAAGNPGALESAVEWLAQAYCSRPVAVRRWSLERKVDRLAQAGSLPPAFVAVIGSAFLVRHHESLLVRFLDVVGVPHRAGALNLANVLQPVPPECLVVGLRTIGDEFGPRVVEVHVHACEAPGGHRGFVTPRTRRVAA